MVRVSFEQHFIKNCNSASKLCQLAKINGKAAMTATTVSLLRVNGGIKCRVVSS